MISKLRNSIARIRASNLIAMKFSVAEKLALVA